MLFAENMMNDEKVAKELENLNVNNGKFNII